MPVKVKGNVGPLVKVPLSSNALTSSSGTGGSSKSFNSGGMANPDSSSGKAALTTSAGIPGMAALRDALWGRVGGVRWTRDAIATTFPFDVVIDGIVYAVEDEATYRRDNVPNASGNEYESLLVVDSDLDPGPHTIEVHLTGAAVAKRLEVFGWLGEAAAGYNQIVRARPPLGAIMQTATTLPTAATAIPYGGDGVGVTVFNTHAATAHTVTIYASDGTSVYDEKSVPARTRATVQFPSSRLLSGWKWKVDAGADVIGWAEVQ